MGKILNYRIYLIGLVLLIGMVSCSKKKEGILFEAVGDVYYVNKMFEGEKRTALAYYAFGNKAITSAIVSLPGRGTVSLDGSLENSFTVFNEPNDEDFSTGYPAEGNYNFDLVSSDGDKLQSSDLLKKENLAIPEIVEIRYEDLDFSYDITWGTVDKADTYQVKMFDSVGKIVFTGNLVDLGTNQYTLIQDDLGTWEKQVVVGGSYTIRLFAFVYDDDNDGTNQMFNIQEISIGETNFIWDEK